MPDKPNSDILLRLVKEEGITPESEFTARDKKVRLVQEPSSDGIVEFKAFIWSFEYLKLSELT